MNYGSWKIDDTLTFTCNTHTPSTGAATDADSVPDYRVYEDETTTAILTGSMAKLDDANTTGFYSEQITLSAANGFEKGKSYNIYISAAVGGVTGTMSHTFQLEAEVDANTVSGAISTVGAVSGAVGSVTGNVGGNVTGSIGSLGTQAKLDVNAEVDTALNTAIPGSPTADSINERIKTVDDAYTATRGAYLENLSAGAVAQESTLGSPAGASLAADIADVKSDTGDILTDTTTDGVVLTAAAVDSILDEVIEGTTTLRQALRIFMAALAGQSTGGGTATLTFRDIADAKARITATVDADGNRTAITLDGS